MNWVAVAFGAAVVVGLMLIPEPKISPDQRQYLELVLLESRGHK